LSGTQLLQYFETAPSPVKSYDASMLTELVERIHDAKFPSELAKGEMLMIFNLRPTSEGALNCVVENLEERFSAEDQEKLRDIIKDVLGGGEQQADGQDAEAEGADTTMQSVENATGS
jgi:hypothetical protein